MTTTDNRLTLIYKEMFGLNNIDNNSGNTTLQGNAVISSKFNIFKDTLLNNNTTIISSLYCSNTSILFGNSSINSNLTISNNAILYNKSTFNSNLNIINNANINLNMVVTNNSIFTNNVTILSNLNINKNAIFNNNIITNNLSSIDTKLNINANRINIGDNTSVTKIIGTSLYIATNQLKLDDRLLTLNIDSTNIAPFDKGELSGIEIIGQYENGYIMTSDDAVKFKIKAPNDSNIKYISVTEGSDDSFNISGNTILYQPTTICSTIFVSSYTILKGSTTFLSALIVSGNSILQGSTTANSSMLVSGNTLLLGYTTINSSLYVNNNTYIQGSTTINSMLNVSGTTNIQGAITILSLLNIAKPTIIYGNITVNSFFYVSGKSIFNGQTTILSSVNISGNSNNLGPTNIYGAINISGNVILNNTTTINSSLSVSGKTSLLGNVILKSNFSIYGNIINEIPEYQDNAAALAGGVPLWGFYRTGGIVKIRIADLIPIISLTGASTINLTKFNYTDPGVYAYDNTDGILPVYLTYFGTSNTNIITTPLLISGSTTIVPNVDNLSVGNYVLIYNTINSNNVTQTISRYINIFNFLIIPYNINNITISYTYNQNFKQSLLFNASNSMIITSKNIPSIDYVATSWRLSNNQLDSIGFNINSDWCFVFKLKILNSSGGNDFGYLNIDNTDNFTDWGPNQHGGLGNLRYYISMQYNSIETNGTVIDGLNGANININNIANLSYVPGCYINISYNYTLKEVKAQIINLSGTTIITVKFTNVTFINPYHPFSFFIHPYYCKFYNNIYYNTNGYVNYNTFIPYFKNDIELKDINNRTTENATLDRVSYASTNITISNNSTSYTELGAIATDKLLNAINVYIISIIGNSINYIDSPILLTGTSQTINFNSSIPTGNYTITYSATDSNNNTTIIIRALIVI